MSMWYSVCEMSVGSEMLWYMCDVYSMCSCTHAKTWRSQRSMPGVSLSFSIFYFWVKVSQWTSSSPFQEDWLVSKPGIQLFLCHSLSKGITHMHYHTGLLLGCNDSCTLPKWVNCWGFLISKKRKISKIYDQFDIYVLQSDKIHILKSNSEHFRMVLGGVAYEGVTD